MLRGTLRLLVCFGTMFVLVGTGCSNSDRMAKDRSYREALAYAEFMCRVTDNIDVGKTEPIPPGMIVASAKGSGSPVRYSVYYRSAHALRLIIAGKLSPPVLTQVTIRRRAGGGFDVYADRITPPCEMKELTLDRYSGSTKPEEEQVRVSLITHDYAEGIPIGGDLAVVVADSEVGRFLAAAWGHHVKAAFSEGDKQSSNAVSVLWTVNDDSSGAVTTFADVTGRPVDFQPSVSDLDELTGNR